MEPEGSLPYSQAPATTMSISEQFCFSRGGVVSASPNPQAGGPPLSAVRDCLFDLFAATLHIGGLSSIRNLRTRHAVVTGTHKHNITINISDKSLLHASPRHGDVTASLISSMPF